MFKNTQKLQDNHILETLAKILIVGLILYGSFLIIQPFLGIILWAIIIAVTINPIITLGENTLKISRTKVSIYFTLSIFVLLLLPTIGLGISLASTIQSLLTEFKAGVLHIPLPNAKVASWPFIGERLFSLWSEASSNLNKFAIAHKDDVSLYIKPILSSIGGGIMSVVAFMASMAIAAVFTSMSESSTALMHTIARRLAGKQGIEWVKLSTMTIRSVVQGVIGIALIQSIVGYIGCVLFGIPFPIVWAILIMLIAIAQLPTLIVLIFPIIYMFSTATTMMAIGFTIFSILLGFSDNVLKPLLLGRGVDAPMLVILLGAIGGLMTWGILGLFIGSVLLAVAYKLFMAWLTHEAEEMGMSTEEIAKLEI